MDKEKECKRLETESIICPICDGHGYTVEVQAQCCGNYKEYGCCGIPNPIQVQVECKCDKGNIPQKENNFH